MEPAIDPKITDTNEISSSLLLWGISVLMSIKKMAIAKPMITRDPIKGTTLEDTSELAGDFFLGAGISCGL
jgi:hypothetical protein